MRNILFIISLGAVVTSCSTQQKIVAPQPQLQPKTKIVPPLSQNKPKVEPSTKGDFYYKTNIGDITKNDNTISYGSVVTAKPKGYKVNYENFPSVAQNFRQRFLILHYTALDNETSVRVLTQRGVSAHYLVSDLPDDDIWQLVDENKRAYHAGISFWRNTTEMNDNSIGIEIVNKGYTTGTAGEKVFYPFPEHQFKKVAALAKDIVERYNIPPTQILAHSDIAPTRKQDPGPFFPWKRLYDEYNLGMWYDATTKQNFHETALSDLDFNYNNSTFISKVQNTLRSFGYDITPTGTWDKPSQKVIEAFQYHFRPEKCDGVLDAETWAILQALIVKYPGK
ncbi:N-acetylmuramoyl-L-alanine amidase [Riemerella anatipestifer]|uniref:N-acetylmuramoyl-L-alanine amidase n=1 Tax=Riemerella anatipestifer TaxID=34085 RepID=A0AAP6HGQ7_RIEAN|nr:N-acetylmuramoyl-L-alanine amidase [Riemerella anatipestifer]MBT0549642.1 N-acetylmuramoyl-L-alanine amidase [Riemerella anatipestifer]MBT0556426.1 N-acetylmuramoyl-L-alanine amidase [Riemerella anatipestifer]MBT0560405.1 N-acetylmuramoyl-L-alanine amidase [Riemerella anatipestifer]MCD5969187.1 N-acetylmuramoyl-L-alanine amidase [Riemerella anatipestifer]MCO7354363.1 N-acetylmuramoyl-L-alanine amidase [Riemerella anatipestifer]